MKKTLQRLLFAVLLLSVVSSCTTAYDEYGRPIQVVEPGTAALGATAAGLLAYGLANHHKNNQPNDDNRGYPHGRPDYHHQPPYPRPYSYDHHYHSYRGSPYGHH
jgi:hypothetical protein